MSKQTVESDDDGTEQIRKDDLCFRSCSAILKAFPGNEINLFPRQSESIFDPEVKKAADRCHKVAFLLVRDEEVVAVMPLRRDGAGISLVVASNRPGSSSTETLPSNARKNDLPPEYRNTEFLPLRWVEDPTSAGMKFYDFLSANWMNISWEHHIGLFKRYLHRAQSVPDRSASKALYHYCHLISYMKNQKRLLDLPRGGISYFKLLERVRLRKRTDFLGFRRPYKGQEDRLCSYISVVELDAVEYIRQSVSDALPETERANFTGLSIFNVDRERLDQKATAATILQILEDFFAVLVAVLRFTKDAYELLSSDSMPNSTLLRTVANRLTRAGHFFYVLELKSKLLPWILNDWLQRSFNDEHEAMVEEVQCSAPVLDSEADEDDDEDNEAEIGDEDADNIDYVEATTIAEKVGNYLRLCFATYRYCRELSNAKHMVIGRVAIAGVRNTAMSPEDWRTTVRWAYQACGIKELWKPKAEEVIGQIETLANCDNAVERNRLKFFRQMPTVQGGVIHCEAALASLYLLGRINSSHIDPEFRRILPTLGSSKPCCPLCSIIVKEINRELRKLGSAVAIPILFTHSTPCTSALPPGLPQRVRKAILQTVAEKVYASLEDLSRESKERAIELLEEGDPAMQTQWGCRHSRLGPNHHQWSPERPAAKVIGPIGSGFYIFIPNALFILPLAILHRWASVGKGTA
ncbi:hypothetical protein BJ508DRAFT_314957 [Ascobolus immersus RN42]|uniref:Uncharacterized protein n=1 Tax=Ascobolus immersus RN42 TaxID=1160509 RepID=A0A3N4HGD4_ASCIM|nr:hypothetical protein BJ508DRAFT_314957 [Ascobolus immersus RN42]